MDSRLCLLAVHAHPDDEASKGAATVALYKSRGVHTVLVCCTGGEEGDINNPLLLAEGGPFHGLEKEAIREQLGPIRERELARAAEAIGFDEIVMLGYRDSGMPDSEANGHPESFAQADLDEAIDRLVRVIREHRPQVILTYGDEQSGYPHPDHLRVHEITRPAFDRAGDATYRPDLGPAFLPLKLYYTVWAKARIMAMHTTLTEMGLESPYDERWLNRPWQDHRITTKLDVRPWFHVRRAALLAHETQIDPTSPFWFSLPDEVAREVYPWEDWVLAHSHVGPSEADWPDDGTFEDDLFAGVTVGPLAR
jgi:mycothiol S-conjugate amidase